MCFIYACVVGWLKFTVQLLSQTIDQTNLHSPRMSVAMGHHGWNGPGVPTEHEPLYTNQRFDNSYGTGVTATTGGFL